MSWVLLARMVPANLKLLSRITSPTTGSIRYQGRIASLLKVGTGFHPEMTGRENIYMNGSIMGMTKKEITRKLDDIDDASASSFRPFFERHISHDAKIVTDEWNGYKPLMDKFNIEQRKSENGKNFPQMHIYIMNVKGWLRGIHHHCSKERMQGYLDEYHFRYNRRNNMDTIFDVLIRRMVQTQPIRLKSDG